jgi:hypothetical protein
VAWLIDSEGQITQYIRASWYRGRGWSPVDESLEPFVFNSIDEIYQLTGDFAPDELNALKETTAMTVNWFIKSILCRRALMSIKVRVKSTKACYLLAPLFQNLYLS